MRDELFDAELEIYARQIVLQDIGYDGQLRLKNAKACIIGLGGLGSMIALELSGMGIGYLRLVDRDIVSRSDLHRQYLYDVDSIGEPKVEVAHRKLGKLNPGVILDLFPESLNITNADEMIEGVDVVLDGLDKPEPRYLLNRTCNRQKIPYIFGAAVASFGHVSTILPGRTACLECFLPGRKDDESLECGVIGVHPSILGLVTAIQVSEAVRLLIGQEPKLLNKLLYINLGALGFQTIEIEPQDKCPVCGVAPLGPPQELADKFFEETCSVDGRRNFIVSPKRRIQFDFEQLCLLLRERGYQIIKSSAYGITFEQTKYITTCILNSGVMIAQTLPCLETNPREEILETYRSIFEKGLGLSENHNFTP